MEKHIDILKIEDNSCFDLNFRYCAATGGSLLVIGSAAGVAFMGMERNVSFGWYVKSIGPAALAGYFLGVGGILAQQALGLSVA